MRRFVSEETRAKLREAGRKGGLATAAKMPPGYLSEIGRKGGLATAEYYAEHGQVVTKRGKANSLRGAALGGSRPKPRKLTDEQALEVRRRYYAGEMQKDLAAEFGVHPSTIGNYINTWKVPQ